MQIASGRQYQSPGSPTPCSNSALLAGLNRGEHRACFSQFSSFNSCKKALLLLLSPLQQYPSKLMVPQTELFLQPAFLLFLWLVLNLVSQLNLLFPHLPSYYADVLWDRPIAPSSEGSSTLLLHWYSPRGRCTCTRRTEDHLS